MLRNADRDDLKESRVILELTSFGSMFQSLGPLTVKEFSYSELVDLEQDFGSSGILAFIPSLSEEMNCMFRSLGESWFKTFHICIME